MNIFFSSNLENKPVLKICIAVFIALNAVVLAILVPLILVLGRRMQMLEMGDDAANGAAAVRAALLASVSPARRILALLAQRVHGES